MSSNSFSSELVWAFFFSYIDQRVLFDCWAHFKLFAVCLWGQCFLVRARLACNWFLLSVVWSTLIGQKLLVEFVKLCTSGFIKSLVVSHLWIDCYYYTVVIKTIRCRFLSVLQLNTCTKDTPEAYQHKQNKLHYACRAKTAHFFSITDNLNNCLSIQLPSSLLSRLEPNIDK